MKELRADIEENGIKIPILVNKEKDTIYDGRNRYMIATELKLPENKIPMEVFKGKDEDIPREIVSRNIHRRHLTDDQRVTLEADIMGPILEAEAKARMKKGEKAEEVGKVSEQIAKRANVGEHKAKAAMGVVKHAKDIKGDVISGKIPLRKAAKVVKARKPGKAKAKKEETLEQVVNRRWITFLNWWSVQHHREVKRIIRERIRD